MESPPDKKLDLLLKPEEEEIEENIEKQNTNIQKIININSSKLNNTKRRNSLNLKNPKYNSKNSKISLIPNIYTNISEKVIMPKIKNNSMKKIKPKMIDEIKIETKKENKQIIDRESLYLFQSIIKIRKEKSMPKLLDEQWHYEKILLDYNIIDFTCKLYNIKINFIIIL